MAERIERFRGPLVRIRRVILWMALFALPWIDRTNISTLLMCALGVLSLPEVPAAWKQLRSSKLFWLFLAYYLAFVGAWLRFPDDPLVRFALEQKAAFAVMPLVLTAASTADDRLWEQARRGFIAGVSAALACCLVYAVYRYRIVHNSYVFFYHDLVSLLSANAIYTSVYVLVSMTYLIIYLTKKGLELKPARMLALNGLLLFLFAGLFLLSSKLLIIAGVILFLYCIYRYARPGIQRAGLLAIILLALTLVLAVPNRIHDRYANVAWKQPEVALKYKDYSTTRFDGLNLRMLLWRMGTELLTEHHAWITGLGGKHYHQALNEKMAAYKLYEGYQNYDLHNQYMEVLAGFGIGGLLWLLFTLICIIGQSKWHRHTMPTILTLIFSVSFLTESLLETQAGILVFTIIISGEWTQRPYS